MNNIIIVNVELLDGPARETSAEVKPEQELLVLKKTITSQTHTICLAISQAHQF